MIITSITIPGNRQVDWPRFNAPHGQARRPLPSRPKPPPTIDPGLPPKKPLKPLAPAPEPKKPG